MDKKLLTIAEIAQKLNMPESTARYYRDRFQEFIPSVGEGRKKRYKQEAIDVLRFIAEGLRNNLTAEAIAEQLSRMFPISVSNFEEPQQLTAAAQQQQPQLVVSALLKALEETGTAVTQLTATVTQLQDEKNKLEDKNDRLFNEFMELNTKYTELLRKNEKGFWARLFGK